MALVSFGCSSSSSSIILLLLHYYNFARVLCIFHQPVFFEPGPTKSGYVWCRHHLLPAGLIENNAIVNTSCWCQWCKSIQFLTHLLYNINLLYACTSNMHTAFTFDNPSIPLYESSMTHSSGFSDILEFLHVKFNIIDKFVIKTIILLINVHFSVMKLRIKIRKERQ